MEKNQSRTPVARQLDRAITCPITAAAKVSGEQDCLRDHDPDDYSRDARRTKLEKTFATAILECSLLWR
jgi:hypothetical protein